MWKKKNKYLDLARELKKLWNMIVTIVPIVSGAFSTITKRLLKGLEDLEGGGRGDGFGLVSLFNGISTFVGYLMPKLFSLKNSSGTI